MVVRRLMLFQLPLVPISTRTDGTHKRLLARVDADVGHVSLATQEPFAAHLTPEKLK